MKTNCNGTNPNTRIIMAYVNTEEFVIAYI
uniref:Uncharacterized protein n=1 Tax=Arundo donax TaxID=35708 RepID=A0A0A8ZCA6_ARUDO